MSAVKIGNGSSILSLQLAGKSYWHDVYSLSFELNLMQAREWDCDVSNTRHCGILRHRSDRVAIVVDIYLIHVNITVNG